VKDLSKRKKILVIDDSELQLIWIRNVLGNDYEVIEALSGHSAFELLEDGLVPDLFLLDIVMPDLDGWGVLHRIMSMNIFKKIPMVFFTGMVDDQSEKRAFELGIFDYIKKPINDKDLLARIKKILK
jgi:putative two-component system response regulator